VDKGLRLGACCLLHPTQQGCCRRCPVPSKEHLKPGLWLLPLHLPVLKSVKPRQLMLDLFQLLWKKQTNQHPRDVCSLPLKVLVWNLAGGHGWRLLCLPGEELIRQLKKHIFRYEAGREGKQIFAIGLVVLSKSIFFFSCFARSVMLLPLVVFSFYFSSIFFFSAYKLPTANPCPSPAEKSAGGSAAGSFHSLEGGMLCSQ